MNKQPLEVVAVIIFVLQIKQLRLKNVIFPMSNKWSVKPRWQLRRPLWSVYHAARQPPLPSAFHQPYFSKKQQLHVCTFHKILIHGHLCAQNYWMYAEKWGFRLRGGLWHQLGDLAWIIFYLSMLGSIFIKWKPGWQTVHFINKIWWLSEAVLIRHVDLRAGEEACGSLPGLILLFDSKWRLADGSGKRSII